jgi:hypothetical protein
MPSPLISGTLISTADFGAHNKVPQEAIPEPVQEKVRYRCAGTCRKYM